MPTADINHHRMYYEIHGDGPPAICMGGWARCDDFPGDQLQLFSDTLLPFLAAH